jgi:hypothetical protein
MQIMLQPYHILLAALVGWANERQRRIIEFQNDQIEALLEKLGKKRVLLTDDQRRVLAVKGREFGAADLSIKENVADRRAVRIACGP